MIDSVVLVLVTAAAVGYVLICLRAYAGAVARALVLKKGR